MIQIPLQAVPSQIVTTNLASQIVRLTLRQRITGLFMDIDLNSVTILQGVLCLNKTKIVRDAYFGFDGELLFYDLQGDTSPTYTGLNTRYFLLYLATSEL